MMKMSILYSLFAVCSLAFCQCDKDGGSASGGNLPFELSVSQWNVPSQGATEEVDLQAPGEWKVKTDYIAGGERWLSVSKTSGAAGQHKLTLSAGNNPSNSTDREALLTVTCGNEQKTISVTQRTHEEVVPEQGRYDVKAGDTLLTVNVSANVAYQCSIVQEGNWIAQVQNKSAMETSSVRFQISANTDEQERTAVVKFTADNLAPTEITIVQAGQTAGKELTLFQLNIWEECGHNSTDGYSAFQSLVDQIVALEPDFATFCELYKNGDDMVMKKLVAALKERGLTYYAETGFGKGGGGARGLLSKYPIEETELINSWMFKGVCNVDGKRIAIYPSHSNYVYYSCYYPRGYNDGGGNSGWEKLPDGPNTDVSEILERNALSGRPESAREFVENAKKELDKGAIVILAGDLNEPSHLDWVESTKDMFEHNGCIVPWQTSLLLTESGFIDAFRQMYPDPATHPGLTWPVNNKGIPVSDLAWAAEAGERDRIDYIYYYPDSRFSLVDIKMVGPTGTIVRGERVAADTQEPIIDQAGEHWPSDHRGLLMTIRWNE